MPDQSSIKIKNIAVIMTMSVESVSKLLEGIRKHLKTRRDLIIRLIDARTVGQHCSFRDFDGIIVDAVGRRELDILKRSGLPIVDLSGESVDDPATISVDCDMRKMADAAADTFLLRGFSSIAYFGLAGKRDSDVMARQLRMRAESEGRAFTMFNYFSAMSPSLSRRILLENERSANMRKWVAQLPRHTAILCLNDRMALMLLGICMEKGRSVPDDLALMGTTNNVSQCMLAPVTLSSIDTNYRGLGYAAMRLLANAIDHPVKPKRRRQYLVPIGAVYERESTSAYPVDPPWLAGAMAYFNANVSRPLSIQEIAESAGVSQTALQTAFHKALGMSVGKYMLTVRMRKANEMVSEGKLSIKEIAAELGFSSRNYFTRVFTDYHGRAPSVAKGAAQ